MADTVLNERQKKALAGLRKALDEAVGSRIFESAEFREDVVNTFREEVSHLDHIVVDPDPVEVLNAAIVKILRDGGDICRVRAVRELRARTGCGLAEAVDYVDKLIKQHGIVLS